MSEETVTRLVDCYCHTGEGPLWHPDEKRLYWVDIPNGILHRYDPAIDEHEQCYQTSVIGGFTIQEDGSLLLFEDSGRIKLWRDDETEVVVDEIREERNSRFNDVVADPRGRVFCGTMPTEDRLGRLYRLNLDGTLTQVLEGINIPNGMGFAPNRETLYVTESVPGKIYVLDYDESTGQLSNKQVFLDLSEEEGVPDGLAVDTAGYVWSARWDGGCLVRYAQNGQEDRRIAFPAHKVSSITFGGQDSTCAYVTTALGPGDQPAGTREIEGDGAGAIFEFQAEISGLSEYRSEVFL